MEKGKTYEIYIHDMTNEGRGFGNVDGLGVFVEGAVAGDTVIAEVTKVKKNYAFAKTIEIVKPSQHRIEPECPYAGLCGGCAYAELDYGMQGQIKTKQVKDKIERIGGVENPKINDIISMDAPHRYRNKAEFPVRGEEVGFFSAKSHKVIDVTDCMLQSLPAMAIADAVRKHSNKHIKHLIVRTAEGTGQVMAVLVCDTDEIYNLEDIVYAMEDAVEAAEGEYSLESVYVNVRDEKDRRHAGDEYACVAGSRTIIEDTGRLRFEISPASFYQVNPEQMEKLYDKAIEYMNLTGSETVLDLYCGVGTIGLHAAEKAEKVIGIETVKEAVIDANRNAVINNIVNARYIAGKAEEVLPALLGMSDDEKDIKKKSKWNESGIVLDQADVAILDPPRQGCDERLLEAVVKTQPERIVYVSCDPATLARDIQYLTSSGYTFIEATPVDMFPWTQHCEVVSVLEKI